MPDDPSMASSFGQKPAIFTTAPSLSKNATPAYVNRRI
jgi:hypothetical protein